MIDRLRGVPFWIPLALALAAVLFVPGLLEQFEVPKTEAVRVCGFACLAWSMLRGWPWRAGRLAFLDLAVLAWLGVELAATVASTSPRLSLFGEPEQREGLITSLALVGLYAAARMSGAGGPTGDTGAAGAPGARRRVTRPARGPGEPAARSPLHVSLEVFAWASAIACVYAVLQATRNDPVPWVGVPSYGGYLRPGGTLGHPNLLGVVTAAAAAVALAAAVASRRRRWVALAVLFTVTNLLTLSRGAWLAAAVALPIAALLARPTKDDVTSARGIDRRQLLVGAAVLVVVTIALTALGLAQPLLVRARELFAPLEGSGRSRLEIWRTALAAWQARPWLGHGPDTFLLVFPQFQTAEYWRQEWGLVPLHAHSVYLHTLATRGALGLAAGATLVIAMLVAAWRTWRQGERTLAAIAISVLVAIGIGGAFGTPGIASAALMMVIAGLLAARAAPAAQPAAASARAARIAAFAAAFVALLGAGAELAASHAAAHARLELLRNPRRAAVLAERAEELMPFDDLYPSLRAQTVLALDPAAPDLAERQADADRAIRRAMALAPRRAIHAQTQGYLIATAAPAGDPGALAAAESSFARALALAPVDGRLLQQYAELELAWGRPDLAALPASRAVKLYPEEGAPHTILALTRVASGDTAGARRALQRAIAGRWRDDGNGRRRAEQALRALAGAPR